MTSIKSKKRQKPSPSDRGAARDDAAEILDAPDTSARPASRHPAPAQTATKLAPGGWLSPFDVGHWEVTAEVAERFGFSSAAVAILRDASQDPDFYEFATPAAHAQTPDAVGFMPAGSSRDEKITAAQTAYVRWVQDQGAEMLACLQKQAVRKALFRLGYLLHAVEDLAPHAGRTNPEHAANDPSPDAEAGVTELARAYALQAMRAVHEALGQARFDELRNWHGDGALAKGEKEEILGHGWDLSPAAIAEYKHSATDWKAKGTAPVRWPRERVLGEVVAALAGLRAKSPSTDAGTSTPPVPARASLFEELAPGAAHPKAKWTVMIYMAGDDASPNGIEYAVRQDLAELKRVGSSAEIHLLAQTDEWSQRNSYRYRLRAGTSLTSDRQSVFRGDLNTGKVSTLVDFVRWGATSFPAERYALVLWGHGSGHDDRDVYRLARGQVTPRVAAQLARKRLGFFGSTRRALLERSGPARGYGYDDTSGDFLDDVELRRALLEVQEALGRPLDLLGFDACLMAMIEVAYQARGTAQVMVASQRSEPGDGWSYADAFADPAAFADPEALARAIVASYRQAYAGRQTLSAVRLSEIDRLADELAATARGLDTPAYDRARRRAADCSSQPGLGYRDLGTFLAALGASGSEASAALAAAVIDTAGGTSGLSLYVPADYAPEVAGGTDELYERLDFPLACGWSQALRRCASAPPARPSRSKAPAIWAGSLHALDRHNAPELLRGLCDGRATHWADRLRAHLLAPVAHLVEAVLETWPASAAAADERIFVLPGIMGSQLSDRRGHNGLCWIDPIGLVAGNDFRALKLAPGGATDADSSVRIEPTGPVPVLYDRLALALLAAFGPIVEQVGYDWRRPIAAAATTVEQRLRAHLSASDKRRAVLVAHSMGGLVARQALAALPQALADRVVGLCTLGTPWLGSFEAVLALRGESKYMRPFEKLSLMKQPELLEITQSFWGLTDLVPPRPEALDPTLYAAGPLGHGTGAAAQLASPTHLKRDPDPRRTHAVACDRHATVVQIAKVDHGGIATEEGPGDGTVPFWSATLEGKLPTTVVDAEHATMPLHGDAITAACTQVARWLGRKEPVLSWPEATRATDADRCTDREALLQGLDRLDDVPLSLGQLLAMMPLA